MTKETLVLFTTNQHQYRVTLCDYGAVLESEMPALVGKTATDVWKWARIHMAKVYNDEFLPPYLARAA